MMGPGYPGDGGDWFSMSLMMVTFWGLIVLLVIVLVRAWTRSSGSPAVPRPAAEDVLSMRYAHGEIDDEEFQRRRRALHAPHAPK